MELDVSKYPSRIGLPWKDEELIQLLTSVKNNENIQEIAKKHKRTEAGIISRLRVLAAEYYINDDKSIEEIKVITGLDKDSIIAAIQKRELVDGQKEKKISQKKQVNTNLDNDRDVILMTLALVVKLHEKVDHLASKIL
jgi:hypothetical protein